MAKRLPKLPSFLEGKINKTGQTRGADDDLIFQNRVNRSNTVLIPFHQWGPNKKLREDALDGYFENGYIVLIPPRDYFMHSNAEAFLKDNCLKLGINALIFYETRADWNEYDPENFDWTPAMNRTSPLGGQFVARVPATTANDQKRAKKINLGYTTKSCKGAGIRLYEYASKQTINDCKLQLEAEYWLCKDSIEVASQNGMTIQDAQFRKDEIIKRCEEAGLLDYNQLRGMRIINKENHTICPLCLRELSGNEFLNRLAQPEGREVPDLTVTQVNLFHIDELKYGAFNHKVYNLGWGHHFCNVVVKDSGIYPTLKWMKNVIKFNEDNGFEIK